MKTKFTLRVPCPEPYAYIEAEIEGETSEAIGKYIEIRDAIEESKQGFHTLLKNIFNSDMEDWGEADEYASLSKEQQDVVQSIKRFAKRLQRRPLED